MSSEAVIVRAPNWVGDAVLAVPALKALRDRLPEAQITLLVRPWVEGLFRSASYIDRVWTHPAPGALRWVTTARHIHARTFQRAVLLTNSFESALTVFAGGVPERGGYATDFRTGLLTRPVRVPVRKVHQTHYYLNLIETLFGPGPEPDMGIEVPPGARETAAALLRREGVEDADRLLILSPGAAFGSAKRWAADRFAGLGDRLVRELGFRAAIIGSPSEQELAERITSLMAAPAIVLTGKTELSTLVGVLSRASLVVTNDSGPMHIAAALGTPTVAIFGPTDVEATGPVGAHTRVVAHPVECSPCMLRECPIDHRCMAGVSVDAAFEASRAVLLAGRVNEYGST